MTRLHDQTLEQLSTGFDTAARAVTRMPVEPTTVQLVAVALHELRQWRAVATPLAEVVRAGRAAVEVGNTEYRTSSLEFERAMAELELALTKLGDAQTLLQTTIPGAQRLTTTSEGGVPTEPHEGGRRRTNEQRTNE